MKVYLIEKRLIDTIANYVRKLSKKANLTRQEDQTIKAWIRSIITATAEGIRLLKVQHTERLNHRTANSCRSCIHLENILLNGNIIGYKCGLDNLGTLLKEVCDGHE